MSTDRHSHRRARIAWFLYAYIVFSVLHCGLGHGQAAGLALAGIGGAFCSHSGAAQPAGVFDDQALAADDGSAFNCPVCNLPGLPPLLLFLGFWLNSRQRLYRSVSSHTRAPPRLHWPTANPRASPRC